jgi:uncharacterized protein YcaQ
MLNSSPDVQLSLPQARRLALDSCLLGPASGLGRGPAAVMKLIDRLGYVQIDSIAVVNRAHHHTVWSRLPGYRDGDLYALLSDAQVFEYWGHAASFLPMSDYRYYLPLMRRYREQPRGYTAARISEIGHLFEPILLRIASEGPLSSADLGNEHGARGGSWWDWKPAKLALEILLWQGRLMVCRRRGFQRVYDLTERVLPANLDLREPDGAQLARFLVRRALQAYGIATERDIRDMLRISRIAPVRAALLELQAQDEIIEVLIEGQPDRSWWISSKVYAKLRRPALRKPRLHILSPFDNMVIQRDRLQRLFGYDYTIECYVPAAKRRYGYFSLPIVWDEQFVGRLDAKALRSERCLDVRAMHLEPGQRADEEFLSALVEGLRSFAAFNRCDSVQISGSGDNMTGARLGNLQRRLAR